MISLCSTMRFNSFTTRGPTHTDRWMDGWMNGRGEHICHVRTFFADKRVVPVVGIVRVAKPSVRILEFEKLVAVLARVTRTFKRFSYNGGAQGARDARSVTAQELARSGREYAY
jgi:hypothetical protein